MKRTILAMVAAMMMTSSVCAQRLGDIRVEANFITDKMAVELGLSNAQRNSIMQLNLNYLNGISCYRDIESKGWKHRNKEMKRILSDKQWKRYKDAYYFYRPIGWKNNAYVHNIYAKYPKSSLKTCKHHKYLKKNKCKPYDKGMRNKEYKQRRNNSPEGKYTRQQIIRGIHKGIN